MGQAGLQRLPLGLAEQFNAGGAFAQCIQIALGLLKAGEDRLGEAAVDLGTGQLFQQLGAFARIGVEKRGELPLRQHHRLGKAAKVQTGQLGDGFSLSLILSHRIVPSSSRASSARTACSLPSGRLLARRWLQKAR